MNIDTLNVPEDEAREKLAEYESVLASERTAEDRAILAAYRAAARGLPVIRLSKTVQAGGFFGNGLPKIAVVRADASECYVYWDWDRALVFSDQPESRNQGAVVGKRTVRVPAERPALVVSSRGTYWSRARTMVPIIPPKHRPRWPRVRNCHLLWEVEAWKPVPPRDPALIRHIRGDLWSVLAVWDLTELERYVLTV